MDLLDHHVVEIVTPPYQRIDDDYCCWEAVVIVDCWGRRTETTFQAVSRSLIEHKARVGYTYYA